MIRGEDKGSEKNIVEKFMLFSSFCHRNVRLIRLIKKLYEVTLVHIFLGVDIQVSGNNISDEKIIFNIVED